MTIEKTNRINVLIDFYGGLLNDKQREALQLYYSEDFSLTEIAESTGATKQAVSDLLRRSEKNLEKFETVLGLADKEERRAEILEKLAHDYPADTELQAQLRALRRIDE
ncbi:putative DNA-binding protein [Lactovum odontotermitis]